MRMLALVLAGGEGRRIGGDKGGRMLGDSSLLDRALDFARSQADQVAIGLRGRGGASPMEVVVDEAGIEGPLASIIAGLRYIEQQEQDALLSLPCDMPFMPGDLAARLTRHLPAGGVAYAASGGRAHPVCALWHVAVLPTAEAYAAAGGRSLKGLTVQLPNISVEWPTADGDPFDNINDPDDLARAEQRLLGQNGRTSTIEP